MVMRLQRVYDWSGGMNTQQDAWLIPENMSVYLENYCLSSAGQLFPKWGAAPIFGSYPANPPSQAAGLTSGSISYGIGTCIGSSHVDRFALWDEKFYINAPTGTWTQKCASATFSNRLHAMTQGRTAVSDSPAIFIYDAEGAFAGWDNDLLTWYDVDTDNYGQVTSPGEIRPSCAAFWQGRMWIGDNTVTGIDRDALLWSELWEGRNYSAAGWSQRVDAHGGDRISAILPARSETPELYIFKKNSVHALMPVWDTDGYVPKTANLLDTTKSKIRNLTYGTGCVASQTARWVPSAEGTDVWFLATDGVRSLRRAVNDEAAGVGGPPLTYKIPDIIDRINWDYSNRSMAIATKEFFFCGLPLDTATWPNYILVKNLLMPSYDGWSVWSFDLGGMLEYQIPATNYRAVYFQRQKGSESHDDRQIYEVAAENSPWEPGNVTGGGTITTAILETRSFDLREPLNRKHWRWVEAHYTAEAVDGSTGATMTIQYARNESTSYSNLGSVWLDVGDAQSVKYGLEDVDPSYRLRFKLTTSQTAKVNLRVIEVVAETQKKEW